MTLSDIGHRSSSGRPSPLTNSGSLVFLRGTSLPEMHCFSVESGEDLCYRLEKTSGTRSVPTAPQEIPLDLCGAENVAARCISRRGENDAESVPCSRAAV